MNHLNESESSEMTLRGLEESEAENVRHVFLCLFLNLFFLSVLEPLKANSANKQ